MYFREVDRRMVSFKIVKCSAGFLSASLVATKEKLSQEAVIFCRLFYLICYFQEDPVTHPSKTKLKYFSTLSINLICTVINPFFCFYVITRKNDLINELGRACYVPSDLFNLPSVRLTVYFANAFII